MKTIAITLMISVLLGGAGAVYGQELPKLPPPTKEHEWLKHFVGEWESDVEIFMEPGKPPLKATGVETARMIGGFWMVAEGKGNMGDTPYLHVFTLGYDPDKKKVIGTWVDSMTSYLWKYEGTVDATGKILTLETEGPCPMKPGLVKFREITEFKSPDHRTFTSTMQGDDGKWITMINVSSRRKK